MVEFAVPLPSYPVDGARHTFITNDLKTKIRADYQIETALPAPPLSSVALARLSDLYDAEFGKWEIVSSGACDTLVMYRKDGSVLQRFALNTPSGPARAYTARTPL